MVHHTRPLPAAPAAPPPAPCCQIDKCGGTKQVTKENCHSYWNGGGVAWGLGTDELL